MRILKYFLFLPIFTFAQQEKVAIIFSAVLINSFPETESVFIMGDFNAWDPGNMGYGNSG